MKLVCCNSYIETPDRMNLRCPECGENPFEELLVSEFDPDEFIGKTLEEEEQ